MEDIDLSVEGMKVIFRPSEKEPPEHLRKWTLYDVYVEDEYMGLVTDTGTDTGERPSGTDTPKMWRALKGNAYEVSAALDTDEIAGVFVRWYYGASGSLSE